MVKHLKRLTELPRQVIVNEIVAGVGFGFEKDCETSKGWENHLGLQVLY